MMKVVCKQAVDLSAQHSMNNVLPCSVMACQLMDEPNACQGKLRYLCCSFCCCIVVRVINIGGIEILACLIGVWRATICTYLLVSVIVALPAHEQ